MVKGTAIRLLRRYLVDSGALDGVPKCEILSRAAKTEIRRKACTKIIVRDLIRRINKNIYPIDAVQEMKDKYEQTLVNSLEEQMSLHNHCAVCIHILTNIHQMFAEYEETQIQIDKKILKEIGWY